MSLTPALPPSGAMRLPPSNSKRKREATPLAATPSAAASTPQAMSTSEHHCVSQCGSLPRAAADQLSKWALDPSRSSGGVGGGVTPSGWLFVIVRDVELVLWRHQAPVPGDALSVPRAVHVELPPGGVRPLVSLVSERNGREDAVAVVAVTREGSVRSWSSISKHVDHAHVDAFLPLQEDEVVTALLVTDRTAVCGTSMGRLFGVDCDNGAVREVVAPLGMLRSVGRLLGVQQDEAQGAVVSLVDGGERTVFALSESLLTRWAVSGRRVSKAWEAPVCDAVQADLEAMQRQRLRLWPLALRSFQGSLLLLVAFGNLDGAGRVVQYALQELEVSGGAGAAAETGPRLGRLTVLDASIDTASVPLGQALEPHFEVLPSPTTDDDGAMVYLVWSSLSPPQVAGLLLRPSRRPLQRGFSLPQTVQHVVGVGATRREDHLLIITARSGLLAAAALFPDAQGAATPRPAPRSTGASVDEFADRLVQALHAAAADRDTDMLLSPLLQAPLPDLEAAIGAALQKLVDARPASGQLWAEEAAGTAFAGQQLVSYQLQEKARRIELFVRTLRVAGLWRRLSPVGGRQQLSAAGEMVAAALAMVSVHARVCDGSLTGVQGSTRLEPGQLLVQAMEATLEEGRGIRPEQRMQAGLSVPDVFYSNVSGLCEGLRFLQRAQQAVQQGAAATTEDIVESVFQCNVVVVGALEAAMLHRQEHRLPYEGVSHLGAWTAEPEMRELLSRQVRDTVAAIKQCAASGARLRDSEAVVGKLFAHLRSLGEVLLHGYQLEAAVAEPAAAVVEAFEAAKAQCITPLVQGGQREAATELAERYAHFESLAELCDQEDAALDPVGMGIEQRAAGGNGRQRLQQYLETYAGFATFLCQWFEVRGRPADVLNLEPPHHEALEAFLQGRPRLAWMHELRTEQYAACAETLLGVGREETASLADRRLLLSLGKLAALADGGDEELAQGLDEQLEVTRIQQQLGGTDGAVLSEDRLVDECLNVVAVKDGRQLEAFCNAVRLTELADHRSALVEGVWRAAIALDAGLWEAVLRARQESSPEPEIERLVMQTLFYKGVRAYHARFAVPGRGAVTEPLLQKLCQQTHIAHPLLYQAWQLGLHHSSSFA